MIMPSATGRTLAYLLLCTADITVDLGAQVVDPVAQFLGLLVQDVEFLGGFSFL